MHEIVEAREAPGSHEDSRLTLPVAVTLSILAVLVAIATLLGHRTSTEEIILQTKATDQWALFQAKNIRLHEMQGFADLLGTLSTADKEKTEALREKYLKEIDRYEQEKDEAIEGGRVLRGIAISFRNVSKFDKSSRWRMSSTSGFLPMKESVPPGSRMHWSTSASEPNPCFRAAASS